MNTIEDRLKKLSKQHGNSDILSESNNGHVPKSSLYAPNNSDCGYIDQMGNCNAFMVDESTRPRFTINRLSKPKITKSTFVSRDFGSNFDSAYDIGNASEVYFDSELINFKDDKFTNNSSSVTDMFIQK